MLIEVIYQGLADVVVVDACACANRGSWIGRVSDGNAGRDFEIEICQKIVDAVIRSRHAWISTILLGQAKRPAIRACITNFRTDPRHIESLVDELSQARAHVQ
jgi:hypothetical protein